MRRALHSLTSIALLRGFASNSHTNEGADRECALSDRTLLAELTGDMLGVITDEKFADSIGERRCSEITAVGDACITSHLRGS